MATHRRRLELLNVRDGNTLLKRNRVILYGLFGFGNFGNDASLAAMCESLRRIAPQLRLVCICGGDPALVRRPGLAAAPIRYRGSGNLPFRALDRLTFGSLACAVNAVRRVYYALTSRALIVPGTGFFDDDFGLDPRGLPTELLRWVRTARLLGCRIGFVSVGAGPIRDPRTKALMVRSAAMAHYRSYRDAASRDFMVRLGVGAADDPVYPDLAFGLTHPTTAGEARSRAAPPTLAIGVLALFGTDVSRRLHDAAYARYIACMHDFAATALKDGYAIRFVTGDIHDAVVISDIVSKGSKDLATARVEPTDSYERVLEALSSADIVVASRFHNIIAALMQKKPVLCIGYNPKHQALMQDIGLPQHCPDIAQITAQSLSAALQLLRQEAASAREKISAAVAANRRRLLAQERAVERTLLG